VVISHAESERGFRSPDRYHAGSQDDARDDLDGFSAFSTRLRDIRWPSNFEQVNIEKTDGDSDPKTWSSTYSFMIRAANGTNNMMAAYFPVMISKQA
jgi:hypothetical protein